jgi:thiol-disulfide isomerase/thioredoxin
MRSLALTLALALAASPALAIPEPASRKAAPDFELKDLGGKRVKLSSLAGKVVIVNFWATWCGPCLQELPHLDKLQQAHGGDLVVLAISTDGPDTLPQVRSVAKRQKWSMPVLLDQEGKVSGTLNPRGTNPYTVFVDRSGRIAERHEGYTAGDEKTYAEWAKALIAER